MVAQLMCVGVCSIGVSRRVSECGYQTIQFSL